MSRRLRGLAVAGCTATLVAAAGTYAPAALAVDAQPFSVGPTYGQVGETVTLTAQGATTFPTDGSVVVRFHGVPAASSAETDATTMTAVVPPDATSGPVDVYDPTDQTVVYTGPSFTLQQPTGWTVTASPTALTFGHKATLTARLSTTGLVAGPVSGVGARLQHRSAHSSRWHHAKGTATKQTGLGGRVHWKVKPAKNTDYRVHFRETPQYAAATSDPLSLRVRPRISLAHLTTAPALSTSHIAGTVHPHVSGRVYLQRHRNGSWHRAGKARTHHGKFSFAISPSSYGKLRYRVVRHGDPLHVRATSRTLHVTVVHRELHYGATGPDVRALQKRLRHLHYDVGPKSKSYGWDMVHAVTAFQKAQGISRDGVAGEGVWKRLADPKRPHLLHKASGAYAVEVDLSKQLLLIAKDGHIWRILDTSTGGGYSYTGSDGQPAVAITPTGHFAIRYKQTGWQTSKLGELYYPSYFTYTGFAIHGEGDSNGPTQVPPYPASHGCVRISNRAVLRYYAKAFAVGTSVWVYQ